MKIRVATVEETLAYGRVDLRRRGLLPPIAGAAIALVQSRGTFNTAAIGTGTTLAYSSNVAAGNLLTAMGEIATTSPGTISVTDTRGTVYTIASFTSANATATVYIAWGYAPSAGANTTTVHGSGSGSPNFDVNVAEFSGAPGLVQDGPNFTGQGTTSPSTVGPTITTTQPGDLLLAAMSSANTGSPGGGWTNAPATVTDGDPTAYQVATVPGTYATAFTTSGTGTWGMIAVALGSSGQFTPHRMPLGV